MKPTIALLLAATASAQNLPQLHDYNRRNILEAAARFTDADLDYRPTSEVRTVRQLLGHIADVQYLVCSEAKGEANPNSEKLEHAKRSQSETINSVRRAFEYCDPLYTPGTDASKTTIAVYHSGQHYGNLVTYMRLRGLQPPSSENPTRKTEVPKLEMTTYYLGLLKKGAAWSPQRTPEAERIQREHLDHMRKTHEAGKLVVAGPIADQGDLRGILIYKTASLEEAKGYAEADPAVKAGRLAVEMHPWMVQKGILP